jgi:DNA-binding MarR family transcriptional regulator
MAESVEQLERAGYVERRPDPHDRRARLVFLTPRGGAVRSVAIAAGRRVEERWIDLTSPQEIETLRATLQRLHTLLGQQTDSDERSSSG